MTRISRRQLICGLAASPLMLYLPMLAAQDQGPRFRYDLASDRGKEMLDIYAFAVGAMATLQITDTRSWLWQWYTHFVDGRTTKQQVMDRFFPRFPGRPDSYMRRLADATWNTCQSHSGQDQFYFLPWHKMYVYVFESIIRQVSGRNDFALPYWNYPSTGEIRRDVVVPAEFRDPRRYPSLYRANRNPNANRGLSLIAGMNSPNDPFNVDALLSTRTYSDDGLRQGFVSLIDSGIHGAIHTLVGDSSNMGAVPFAAGDPIFWVHHASIDRIWASWNESFQNPENVSQLATSFTFADAFGRAAVLPVSDYMNPLDYIYDSVITSSGQVADIRRLRRTAQQSPAVPLVIARSSGTTSLQAGQTTIPLYRVDKRDSMKLDGDYFVVVRNLQTAAPPGVMYHLYLTSDTERSDASNYIGSIHFFGAESLVHAGHAKAAGGKFFSFEVTKLIAKYFEGGLIDDLKLIIVAGGSPAAQPTIGTVELAVQ